jgi:DNA-directed RNA polymerase subunit H (RpoH/RPB5)
MASKSDESKDSKDILMKYNARKTILQLLKAQGYKTQKYENFSINEVSALHAASKMNMLLTEHNSREDSHAYVHFCDKITSIKNFDQCFYEGDEDNNDILRHDKEDMLVIISKFDIPDTFNKLINDFYEEDERKKFIVAFTLGTLQYNILDHELVPKHTILTRKEKEGIMKKYNVTHSSQFPTISRFDAVAKAIGMRPDEVCRIERSSNTSITSEYYRLCTK